MVDIQLVEKFNSIFQKIATEKGELYLFMIVKMDDLSDKWSVVISAPWIDLNRKNETFDYLRGLARNRLNQEELLSVARIGIFEPTSPLVRLITSTIRSEGGANRLQNTKINGFSIHDAYIFRSVAPPNQ